MFGSYALALGRGRHRHALELRATSLGLPHVVSKPELLFVATARAAHLESGDTLLVGQIFDEAGTRLDALPDGIEHAKNLDELSQALRLYWGNFVLFRATSEGATAYREPSGSVPVYRVDHPGGATFVSDAALAEKLGLVAELGHDQNFLVHWLQYPFLRTRRTGVETVSELPPGAAWSWTPSGPWREASLWHPCRFAARAAAIRDPAAATEALRDVASRAIGAQVGQRHILLRLSGGLDSSIIAACLAERGHQFACINFATRSRDGDERDYARAVAEALGLVLVEVGEPEPAALKVPEQLAFRPSLNPMLAPFETAIADAASELDAPLLIDGGGGDNLFCSITSAAPVIDALVRGGWHEAGNAVADIAARANCSIWKVVGAAVPRAMWRRPAWREDRSFLRRSALLGKPELHPWLEHLDVPPGKREHVEALVHVQHFLDRSPTSTNLLHPLLAQPLLELCLRIPSWYWMRGGRDRAIARDAFVGRLPASVLQRRLKGSLQSMLYRSFERQRIAMLDLLVSGELARREVIDPDAVGAVLTSDRWMTDEVQLRVSEIVALELWLQSWRSRATTPATVS